MPNAHANGRHQDRHDHPGDDPLQQRCTLPDGRTLGYAEFGDPAGLPCFFFHGIPGSRYSARLVDGIARAATTRVIGVDRPGMGLSTYQSGRTFLDWPADIAALADRLGLNRFAVVGMSGGGAYVAACAWAMPERLTAAGLLSGMGPLDTRPLVRAFTRGRASARIGLAAARWMPRLAAPILERQLARSWTSDQGVLAGLVATTSPVDRAVMARPEVESSFLADFREAFRQGSRGAVADLLLYARPWGFDLREIAIDVHLWHGLADANVPARFGQEYVARIPRVHAVFYPGEGHLMAANHLDEIVRTMAHASRRSLGA